MIEILIVVWAALLGLVVGSFLNVVIYRLHTGKSLAGRSHCMSCGHQLSNWHLVPVFSFLLLRARCHFCTARISPRYILVELLTGFLFGLTAAVISDPVLGVLVAVFMAILVVIFVYDLLHTIIPDEYVLAASGIALLIGALDAVYAHEWSGFLMRLVGAAAGFVFFGFLWLVSRGRWIGFGDAKLAVPLGFVLAWPGIVSAIILAFWVGAGVSVCILLLQRLIKRGQYRLLFLGNTLTIKSEVPFAPFLIFGFLLAFFFHVDVFMVVGHVMDSFMNTLGAAY